jgi:hypothetical protein
VSYFLSASLYLFIIYWWDCGLTSGLWACKASALLLSHTSSPFFSGYFGDGILRIICLGWLQTVILPISASQVARITDVTNSSCLSASLELLHQAGFTGLQETQQGPRHRCPAGSQKIGHHIWKLTMHDKFCLRWSYFKSISFVVRYQPCHLLALWPWTSHLTFLSITSFTTK